MGRRRFNDVRRNRQAVRPVDFFLLPRAAQNNQGDGSIAGIRFQPFDQRPAID